MCVDYHTSYPILYSLLDLLPCFSPLPVCFNERSVTSGSQSVTDSANTLSVILTTTYFNIRWTNGLWYGRAHPRRIRGKSICVSNVAMVLVRKLTTAGPLTTQSEDFFLSVIEIRFSMWELSFHCMDPPFFYLLQTFLPPCFSSFSYGFRTFGLNRGKHRQRWIWPMLSVFWRFSFLSSPPPKKVKRSLYFRHQNVKHTKYSEDWTNIGSETSENYSSRCRYIRKKHRLTI